MTTHDTIHNYFIYVFGGNKLYFELLYFHKKIKKILQDDEFKLYVSFLMIFSLFVFLLICYKENIFIEYNFSNLEMTLRESIFQIVSVITTTGFVTSDYTQ